MPLHSTHSVGRRVCAVLLALLVSASGLWSGLPLLAAGSVTGAGGQVGAPAACDCGCAPDGGSCCCAGEPEFPSNASPLDPCFRSAPCSPVDWMPQARDILKDIPPASLCLVRDPGGPCGPVPVEDCAPLAHHRAPDTPPPISPNA